MVNDPRRKTYPNSSDTEIKKGSALEWELEPLDYVNNKYLSHTFFVPGLVL